MNKFGVTEKEFSDWLGLPCTEAYMEFIRDQIEARKEIAGSGGCLAQEGFQAVGQRYFVIMSTISIYENMLEDIKKFDLILPSEEEENSDDSNSQESPGGQDSY